MDTAAVHLGYKYQMSLVNVCVIISGVLPKLLSTAFWFHFTINHLPWLPLGVIRITTYEVASTQSMFMVSGRLLGE